MPLTCDWHIHSEYSCDEACMKVADLPSQVAARGIVDFGLTDHLHTPYNLPDLQASRRAYLAATPSPRFHFGVELSVVSQWELDELARGGYADPVYGLREGGPPGAAPALGITAEGLASLGVEYVVAGAHWPLYVPWEREAIIRDYHRQNMFLATHPLVTIIAHPWWWMGHWQSADGVYRAEPWFDRFDVIPQSMHDEFAAAAIQHGTAVEINLSACLFNPEYPERFGHEYVEYLAGLKARGVTFSLASDNHDAGYAPPFDQAAERLGAVGIHDRDLWRLAAPDRRPPAPPAARLTRPLPRWIIPPTTAL
jgi:histidinol phosphatase-like PHP family hydrolase